MNINYGKLEGRFFEQWRVDKLIWLAEWVNDRLGIVNFYIWYDAQEDFTRMAFWHNNVNCTVSFYKIYRLDVDGGEQSGYGRTRRFHNHDLAEIPYYVKEWTPKGNAGIRPRRYKLTIK